MNKVYPNPFNPNITIDYSVGNFDYITIDIVDLNGTLIDRLIDNKISSGNYITTWDASRFSTGIYFVRITSKQIASVNFKKISYLK